MAVSGLAHEKPLVVWSQVGWMGTGLWVWNSTTIECQSKLQWLGGGEQISIDQ